MLVGFQAHLWLEVQYSDGGGGDAQACNGGNGVWRTGDGLSSLRRGVMERGGEVVEALGWDAGDCVCI